MHKLNYKVPLNSKNRPNLAVGDKFQLFDENQKVIGSVARLETRRYFVKLDVWFSQQGCANATSLDAVILWAKTEYESDYIQLGCVAHALLDQQTHYVSRYTETHGEGLRFKGTTSDYHGMEIHKDDVVEFVKRVDQARKDNPFAKITKLAEEIIQKGHV